MIPVIVGLGVLVVIFLVSSPILAAGFVGLKTTKRFDPLIADAASRQGIPPHILKAIVAKESGFNPDAINPESSFILDGVTYSPGSSQGRGQLRDFLKSGGSLSSVRRISGRQLNPSIGLAQVRVSTARKFILGVQAFELFNPVTNLTAASELLRELFSAGITLDTIDAYNVGQDLSPRNLPYRDRVRNFARTFEKDFV